MTNLRLVLPIMLMALLTSCSALNQKQPSTGIEAWASDVGQILSQQLKSNPRLKGGRVRLVLSDRNGDEVLHISDLDKLVMWEIGKTLPSHRMLLQKPSPLCSRNLDDIYQFVVRVQVELHKSTYSAALDIFDATEREVLNQFRQVGQGRLNAEERLASRQTTANPVLTGTKGLPIHGNQPDVIANALADAVACGMSQPGPVQLISFGDSIITRHLKVALDRVGLPEQTNAMYSATLEVLPVENRLDQLVLRVVKGRPQTEAAGTSFTQSVYVKNLPKNRMTDASSLVRFTALVSRHCNSSVAPWSRGYREVINGGEIRTGDCLGFEAVVVASDPVDITLLHRSVDGWVNLNPSCAGRAAVRSVEPGRTLFFPNEGGTNLAYLVDDSTGDEEFAVVSGPSKTSIRSQALSSFPSICAGDREGVSHRKAKQAFKELRNAGNSVRILTFKHI